jgi:hypothetical protein
MTLVGGMSSERASVGADGGEQVVFEHAGSSARAASSEVLVSDDFKSGFDPAETWALVGVGAFTANDGVVVTSPSGLCVQSSGTNPATGDRRSRSREKVS